MLRICNLAGETLATFSADEVEGQSVKMLKASYAKQTGITRFRQRWLAEDHSELQDDAVVPCCDVQLVVLSFVQAEEEELEQLVSACNENRPDEVVDLLRKPLNPDGLASSLRVAAENGHLQILQLLLEATVDQNAADQHGTTALNFAAFNGHTDIVQLLLEAGADKDSSNELGSTALHSAAWRGHLEVVKLLVEVGCDKDIVDHGGRRPLHRAAQNGHSEVIRYLLDAGADKDAAAKAKWTALHFAAVGGHSNVVKLLLEYHADKDAVDSRGKSPLDFALHYDHHEIVNLLQPQLQTQKRQKLTH